jgi:RNA polymerase sigma-70 factor (ECF subfamily)
MGENAGSINESSPGEITQLLVAWSGGDRNALDRLAPLVNSELRRIALQYMHRGGAGQTLGASGLINEAYLRLIDWKTVGWESRAHFFAVAAKMMRRILVNNALHRKRSKRGGGAIHVTLNDFDHPADAPNLDLIALDEALTRLQSFDERKSRIVELRFFGGLTEEEIVEVLGIPLRTIQREWSLARSWLFRELRGVETGQ